MKKILFVFLSLCLIFTECFAEEIDVFKLAENGTPKQLQEAINKGANVNVKEGLDFGYKTPLHYAASYNHNPKSINFLISKGLDVNDVFYEGNIIFGTPLTCAIRNKNIDAVYELLKAGADPNSFSNDGNYTYGTPLHVIAMKYKDNYSVTKKVIAALIKAGSNINYHENPDSDYYEYYSDIFLPPRNQWEAETCPLSNVRNYSNAGLDNFLSSFTPLMYAVLYDNADVVDILLKEKANANIRNVEGKTALDYARELPKNSSIKKSSTYRNLIKTTNSQK